MKDPHDTVDPIGAVNVRRELASAIVSEMCDRLVMEFFGKPFNEITLERALHALTSWLMERFPDFPLSEFPEVTGKFVEATGKIELTGILQQVEMLLRHEEQRFPSTQLLRLGKR